MGSPSCLCVCPPHVTNSSLEGDHATECDHEATTFVPEASTIPKMADVQTSDVDTKRATINVKS
jgi:hypothetical protein